MTGSGPAQDPATARDTQPLWTRPFVLIAVLQFLCYANHVMVRPVLALYLTELGETPAFIGLVFAVFGMASLLSRPFIGQGVDGWSARGVFAIGGLALGAASLGYLWPAVIALIVARGIHGMGWAAINTAGPTLAAAAVPAHRRGEAFGYLTMIRSVALPTAPALGLWMVGVTGFELVFVLGGGLGLLAGLGGLKLRDAARTAATAAPTERGVRGALVERRALLPAAMQTTLFLAAPIANLFVVVYAEERGIEDISLYFLASGIATIAAQPLARLSDRWGRAPNIVTGMLLAATGLAVMMFANSLLILVIAGVLWSMGSGLVEPATTALAMDKVPVHRRGAAMATFTAAFQIGNAVGGLLWGFVIGALGFAWMFPGGIVLALLAVVVVVLNWEAAQGGAREAERAEG